MLAYRLMTVFVLGTGCLAAPAFAQQSAVQPAEMADGAQATSMKQCGALYRKAKADGTLDGADWTAFRRTHCTGAKYGTSAKGAEDVKVTPAVAPASVTFPSAISSAYASETPAKQRMHTCLEGYHANKDAGTLGGLRWIQKGGGYYSLCNARLKS